MPFPIDQMNSFSFLLRTFLSDEKTFIYDYLYHDKQSIQSTVKGKGMAHRFQKSSSKKSFEYR